MKMYTNESQTAKLIELGFEKPSPKWVKDENGDYRVKTNDADYDIGELLSFLPENVAKQDEIPSTLSISVMHGEWCVQYADFLGVDFEFCNTEPIDALYDMCVRLKEKGVI